MLRRTISGLPMVAAVEKTGWFSKAWRDWLQELLLRSNATGFQAQAVALTAQGAAITTTAVPIGAMPSGLYRVSYRLRVTRAATSSSSATVTLGWTDGGVACSQAFAAVTGNTTATVQSGSVLVRADAASSLTYAVAYASVGATSMQFAFDVVVEAIPGVTT